MKDENENNQSGGMPENFGLPKGYFQKSAGSIMNKIEWQEEHADLPKLSALKNSNAFLVPENYFSKNEQQLENLGYPTLNKLRAINSFKVPEKYFECLEVSELAKVLGGSEDESFSKLDAIKKQNNFKVPANYFLENESRLNKKVLPAKEAKVISLSFRKISLAAAAILVAAIGIWLYNFYYSPAAPVDCGTLACVDKQDLVKTKNLENLDDEELYDLVDPSALEKKLESPQTKKLNNENKKDSSLNEMLDEELLEDI